MAVKGLTKMGFLPQEGKMREPEAIIRICDVGVAVVPFTAGWLCVYIGCHAAHSNETLNVIVPASFLRL